MSRFKVRPSVVPEVYQPYLKNFEPKIQIFYGSRNSAKSDFIASKLIFKALKYEQERCILVRNHHNSIKDSQWQTIKDVWERWNRKAPGIKDLFTARFNVSPLEIRFNNGARMIARGMDEAGKTKSIKDPTTVWFEEANELKEEAFWDTVYSIRSPHDVPLNVFVSFNPGEDCDPDHWLVKSFFPDPDIFQHPEGKFHEVESIRDDVSILHTTYLDNPYRNPDFDQEMQELKRRDIVKYQMKGLGLFKYVQSSGVLIPSFDRKIHTFTTPQPNIDPESALYLSLDFNVNPAMHAGVCQLIRKDTQIVLRIIDEIRLENPNNSTKEVCLEYKRRYGKQRGHFYTGDASGKNRQTVSTQYKNDYAVVEDVLAGMLHQTSDKVPRRNPNLLSSRDFIRDLFSGAYDYITIEIDEQRCPYLVRDLERLKEDKDGKPLKEHETKGNVRYEKYGHCFDWFKYFVVTALEDLYDNRYS